MRIQDTGMDSNALPDTLRHRAKLFELTQYTIGVFELSCGHTQMQFRVDLQYAHTALRIATDFGMHNAAHRLRRLLELAKSK